MVFLLTGISIFLYLVSPKEFNYTFILVLFIIFLWEGYLSIRKDIGDKQFITFHTLFFLSFFLTTFAFPVFIFPFSNYDFLPYFYLVNISTINKASALALVGFSSYVSGVQIAIKLFHKNRLNSNTNVPVFSIKNLRFVVNFFTFVAFIIFVNNLYNLIGRKESVNNFDIGWVSTILYIVFIFGIVISLRINKYTDLKSYIFRYWFMYSLFFLIALQLLYLLGDRGIVLSMSLVIISCISLEFKRLKRKYVILGLFLGIVVMFFVGNSRNTSDSLRDIGVKGVMENSVNYSKDVGNLWIFFNDLTSISRNLYIGYEWKMNNDFYIPERIFFIALSPVPFLPSLLSDGNFQDFSSTGKLVTSYTSSRLPNGIKGGLGTHCVVDVFMSWGLLGVVLLFCLFGYLTASFRLKVNSMYSALAYYSFVAFSIYIPRSTIFETFRVSVLLVLVWGIFRYFTNLRQTIY